MFEAEEIQHKPDPPKMQVKSILLLDLAEVIQITQVVCTAVANVLKALV